MTTFLMHKNLLYKLKKQISWWSNRFDRTRNLITSYLMVFLFCMRSWHSAVCIKTQKLLSHERGKKTAGKASNTFRSESLWPPTKTSWLHHCKYLNSYSFHVRSENQWTTRTLEAETVSKSTVTWSCLLYLWLSDFMTIICTWCTQNQWVERFWDKFFSRIESST